MANRIYVDAQETLQPTNAQATTTQTATSERYNYDETTKTLTVYGVGYRKDKQSKQYELTLQIDLADASFSDLVTRAASSMVISFQGALRTKSPELLQQLNGTTYRTTFKGLTSIVDPNKAFNETRASIPSLTEEQRKQLIADLMAMDN